MKELKKFLLMLFAVAMPMALATSCNDNDPDDDDDDDGTEVILADKAAGTYKGSYATTVNAQEYAGGIVVTLVKTDDDEVSVKFSDIKVLGMEFSFPDITGAELSGTENNIKVEGKTDTKLTTVAGELNAKVKLNGTITNANDLALTLAVTSEDEPLKALGTITVTLTVAKDGELPDDGGEDEGDLADDAEGIYLGAFETTVVGMEFSGGVIIDIAKTGENEVSMEVSPISLLGGAVNIVLPTLEGLTLTDENSDGVTTIQGTVEDVEIMNNATTVNISGTITEANNLTMSVTIEGIPVGTVTISVKVAKDGQLPDDGTLAGGIQGKYDVTYTVAELGDMGAGTTGIVITQTGDAEVTLTFDEISFLSGLATATIPPIEGVILDGTADNVGITETIVNTTLGLGGAAAIVGNSADATVTISGSVVDKGILTIDVLLECPTLEAVGLSTLNIAMTGTK